ncbi:MAG: UDP-3-O-(3-hydroxymyristoyl)glucosamine N-acyltransferase [Flavobacteriales bacterium]|nr:UDP-3-O-(3-hydroxymyristoyl)glucosamine N-acyltransferase [Flavobacteriales bacterium]
MKFTAQQIADLLNGNIEGNGNVEVRSVAKIEDGCHGDLCFLANEKYTPFIYSTNASVVIVNNSFTPDKNINATLIKVEDAYSSFSKLLQVYNKMKFNKIGLSDKADINTNTTIGNDAYIGAFTTISEGVIIGENVKIYPNCYIGENVKIAKNTIIFPNVSIYHDCEIGEDNIIHSGVVIGSDGFGFAPDEDNNYNKISQIGNVKIGNDVEIGANTTIDRATMGSTIIENGVKLDNMIQIAHNVIIGKNTVIAAQTGIAGSTKIGKHCMIGGQVAVSGHLNIADEVKVAGQSGIAGDITEKGKVVQGPMAFDIRDFQRSYIVFRKLPEMYKSLRNLQKKIDS